MTPEEFFETALQRDFGFSKEEPGFQTLRKKLKDAVARKQRECATKNRGLRSVHRFRLPKEVNPKEQQKGFAITFTVDLFADRRPAQVFGVTLENEEGKKECYKPEYPALILYHPNGVPGRVMFLHADKLHRDLRSGPASSVFANDGTLNASYYFFNGLEQVDYQKILTQMNQDSETPSPNMTPVQKRRL